MADEELSLPLFEEPVPYRVLPEGITPPTPKPGLHDEFPGLQYDLLLTPACVEHARKTGQYHYLTLPDTIPHHSGSPYSPYSLKPVLLSVGKVALQDLDTFRLGIDFYEKAATDKGVMFTLEDGEVLDAKTYYDEIRKNAEQWFKQARSQLDLKHNSIPPAQIAQYGRAISAFNEQYKKLDPNARALIQRAGVNFYIDYTHAIKQNIYTNEEQGWVSFHPEVLQMPLGMATIRDRALSCALFGKDEPTVPFYDLSKAEMKALKRLPAHWPRSKSTSFFEVLIAAKQEPHLFRKILPISYLADHQYEMLAAREAYPIFHGKPAPTYEASNTEFSINEEKLTGPQQAYFKQLNAIIAKLGVTPEQFNNQFGMGILELSTAIDVGIASKFTGIDEPISGLVQRSPKKLVPQLAGSYTSPRDASKVTTITTALQNEMKKPQRGFQSACFGGIENSTIPTKLLPHEKSIIDYYALDTEKKQEGFPVPSGQIILQKYASGEIPLPLLRNAKFDDISLGGLKASYPAFNQYFSTAIYNSVVYLCEKQGIDKDTLRADLDKLEETGKQAFLWPDELGKQSSLSMSTPAPVDRDNIPLRLVGLNDVYVALDGALRTIHEAESLEDTMDHFSVSPLIFRPSDFDHPERLKSKLDIAEAQAHEFSAFAAKRLGKPIDEVESRLRQTLGEMRQDMNQYVEAAKKLLSGIPPERKVSDEEVTRFGMNIRTNSAIAPDYLLSSFSRNRMTFVVTPPKDHYDIVVSSHWASAPANVAALPEDGNQLADFIMGATYEMFRGKPEFTLQTAQIRRDLTQTFRREVRSTRFDTGSDDDCLILQRLHSWLSGADTSVNLDEVRRKLYDSVKLYEAFMDTLKRGEQPMVKTPSRPSLLASLTAKRIAQREAAVSVLAPDDFVVLPPRGEILPIAAYLREPQPIPFSIALATFSLRDLNDPEVLRRKLDVSDERIRHAAETLELLKEGNQNYSNIPAIVPEDVKAHLQNIDATAIAESARQFASSYGIEECSPQIEEARTRLLKKLTTPSALIPMHIVQELQDSRSVFVLAEGEGKKETDRNGKKKEWATNNSITLLDTDQTEDQMNGGTDSVLRRIVFGRLLILHSSEQATGSLENLTAEFDAARGEPEENPDDVYMLGEIHNEICNPAEYISSGNPIKKSPLNLYTYHGLMCTMKSSQRRGQEPHFPDTAGEAIPLSNASPEPEREFWLKLNGIIENIGTTGEEFQQEFTRLYSKQMINLRATSNTQSLKINPRLGIKITAEQESLPNLLSARTVIKSNGLDVSIVKEMAANAMLINQFHEANEGADKAVAGFVETHSKVVEDVINTVYKPLMGEPCLDTLLKDAVNLKDGILYEYAIGIRSLPDLINVRPQYWAHCPRLMELPSPQEVFIRCLHETCLSAARQTGIDKTSAWPRIQNELRELDGLFKKAVRPSELDEYEKLAAAYRIAHARFTKLGVPSDFDVDLRELMRERGFSPSSNQDAPAPLPEKFDSPYDQIPAMIPGRLDYLKRAQNYLDAVLPMLEEDQRTRVLARRADIEINRIKAVSGLQREDWIPIIADAKGSFPDLGINMEHVLRVALEPKVKSIEPGQDPLPVHIAFLGLLAAKAEEAAKQKKAVKPTIVTPGANTEKPTMFDASQKVANRLHGLMEGKPTHVLAAVWPEVRELHQIAKKSPDMARIEQCLFADAPMLVLEYLSTPASVKLGDQQSIGKRFSNTRAGLPMLKKTLEDILELAAIERGEPGEKPYFRLTEAILSNPTLLICATGNQSFVERARIRMHAQAAGFSSEECNAGLVREALERIGIREDIIDTYYPPPLPPAPKYITNKGNEFYTHSPRHVDLGRALDILLVDAEAQWLDAIRFNRTQFKCELSNDLKNFRLIFADADNKNEKEVKLPVPAKYIDDIVDLHIALQSYVLNKSGIEPLRRRQDASGRALVALSDPVPWNAGDPSKSKTHVNAGGGQLYMTVDTTAWRKPIRLSLPLGVADTPENQAEAEARKQFVQDRLQEMTKQKLYVPKYKLISELKKHVIEQRKQQMIKLDRIPIGPLDDEDNPEPIAITSFPQKREHQQSTFLGPPVIQLEPGGTNPSYVLILNIHVKQGGGRGIGDTVRGLQMRLHTSNEELATARARMAIEELKEAFLIFAGEHPDDKWELRPQSERLPRRSPLYVRSESGLNSNVLESMIDHMTQYEHDAWVEKTKEKGQDDASRFKLKIVRGRNRHSLNKPYNQLINAPTDTIETMRTTAQNGDFVPMQMEFHAPNAIPGQIEAFINAVQESFHATIGAHYAPSLAVRPGSIGVPEGEVDIYIPAREYREKYARNTFAHAVAHNLHILGEGAQIITPLPKPPHAERKEKHKPGSKPTRGGHKGGDDAGAAI